MKEAYGGISNLVFIAVFLTIVMGALGLTVSYTKAFHMKNSVIRAIENHEGAGCFEDGTKSSPCRQEILAAATQLTYKPSNLDCHGMANVDNLYCYQKVSGSKTNTGKCNSKEKCVYRIITQIDLSFPIVEKITGFRMFQISGDTREFIKP